MQSGESSKGLRRGPARRAVRRAGLSLLEMAIALLVVSTVLMASAGAFMTNVAAATDAQRRSRAALFLETVMEDLSAQPFEDLLAFDGNRIFEGATPGSSRFGVDLTAFTAAANLTQVEAALVDLNTGREIGRATTLRTRR